MGGKSDSEFAGLKLLDLNPGLPHEKNPPSLRTK